MFLRGAGAHRDLHSFPTRRSSDLNRRTAIARAIASASADDVVLIAGKGHERYQEIAGRRLPFSDRSEEHTSELQSHSDLVCRLLLEKKKTRPRRRSFEGRTRARSS